MIVLLAVVLLVGLVLRALGRVGIGTPAEAAGSPPSSGSETLVEQWALFSEAFVRHRLRDLADELERLDRDPEVFARAFHTMAARAAYDALLAEASVLSSRPRWHVGEVVDVDALGSSTGRPEVLEV